MIQGTASNVGKSLITAGLCRIFMQAGYKTAPFKSQNMALNSYITDDCLEIGYAQAAQARAAGIAPTVFMNPVLLKPNSDTTSQVILNGKVYGDMTAREYFKRKAEVVPYIKKAYDKLAAEYDIIVIEGAGSPAEINLKKDDFVNMGMAKMAKAPVLLVGDIERGGVFAQIYGTVKLLDKDEQDYIKAVIVNKFRGDITLFDGGRIELGNITKKPVAGVIPYFNIDIGDEDSLSERLNNHSPKAQIDIAVIRLPRISNFTDFAPLEATDDISVRYVAKVSELRKPDMLIIPGTKSTVSDMKWLRESGLETAVKKLADKGVLVFGVCGGYQILGDVITDESGNSIAGMGLLPVETTFYNEKQRAKTGGLVLPWNVEVYGYEIHMGATVLKDGAKPFIRLTNGEFDGCTHSNVYGSYLHGFFDSDACRDYVYTMLAGKQGAQSFSLEKYREQQYDKLAAHLREHLDMELIYKVLEAGV